MKNAKRVSLLAALIALLVSLSACGQSKKVTVPNVRYDDPTQAYDKLREAGLRVSIGGACFSASLVGDGAGCAGVAVKTEPQSGHTLTSNSIVAISLSPLFACDFGGYKNCLRGGKRIPRRNSYPSQPSRTPDRSQLSRMPDLVGKPLSAAIKSVGCFQITVPRLPPLRTGDKPHLLDNYVVVNQSPAAGAITEVTASSPLCTRTVTVRVTISN